MKVPTEYYAKDTTGKEIMGLLEVVESDFTKALAEAMASEESAQNAYEKLSKKMRLIKQAKNRM